MYRGTIKSKTSIRKNDAIEAQRLEDKIADLVNGNGSIEETAPLIYTEKKDGVSPSYNIRTDRFEVALDAKDAIQRMSRAKREEKPGSEESKKSSTEVEE